jgi:ribosomal protein S18 acetylase RimI-like enzyme
MEDLATVRELIDEYRRWIDLDAVDQEIGGELAALPGSYAPPSGILLVGCLDDRIAGVVGGRRLSTHICEMKRLYVRPAGRGTGLARALVTTLLAEARERGYREVYLDTLPKMASAQRLYESLGFRDIPPYYPASIPGTRFMSRSL